MGLFSTHPPLEERIARLRGVRPLPVGPVVGPDPRSRAKSFWDRMSG